MGDGYNGRDWYLVFQSEYNTTEGIMGPYTEKAQGQAAMDAMLGAEATAVDLVDSTSPLTVYPYFYHHIKLLDLDESELRVLESNAFFRNKEDD